MELEPGPLTPIDADALLPRRVSDDAFEQALGRALLELGDVDGATHQAATIIAEAAAPAPLDNAFGAVLADVEASVADSGAALDTIRAEELAEATNDQLPAIENADNEYRDAHDEAPPHIPDYDPGEAPGPGGDDGGPLPA
jgi:hypothetical protein